MEMIRNKRIGFALSATINMSCTIGTNVCIFVREFSNCDGMLGTGLPASMYTTKAPIDMWRFNVPQLKEFLAFSVKNRYQLNYFICVKDFNS
jgi:hypothetical protein